MKILKYLIAIVALVGIILFISGEKEIASLDRPIPANLSENLREDTRKLPFTGAHNFRAVSYTHLTLPTICSV